VTGEVLPEGYVVHGTISGRQLSGTCVAGREVLRLELTMGPDGDSFSGTMRYQTIRRAAHWEGQRVAETPDPVPAPSRGTQPRRR
jgi:hypothetical protein